MNTTEIDLVLDIVSLTLSFVTGVVCYLLWKEIKKGN